MTVTIEHLTLQRKRAKEFLSCILNLKPESDHVLSRIIMDKHNGSIHVTTNDPNYERSAYLIELIHTSTRGFTQDEKARILFSMLHRFNLKAYKLNNDWEAL